MNYYGGHYSVLGDVVYLPQSVCNKYSIEGAFQIITGFDTQHIIHYSPDELYTHDGTIIDGEHYEL